MLGLDFEGLGVGVARVWGLPESLQRCMRKPLGSPIQRVPEQGVERLRRVAMAANEVASALLFSEAATLDEQLAQIGTRYARSLALPAEAIGQSILRGRHKLVALTRAGVACGPRHPRRPAAAAAACGAGRRGAEP